MVRLSSGSLALLFLRWYFSTFVNEDGVSVMEEDWDTLVILDACRYDMFQRISDLPGELSMRRSQASATDDFLRMNFDDGPYHDTVYVTANPRLDEVNNIKKQFYNVVDAWHSDWDDELETVPPAKMAARTIEAHEEYPEKRIISHFIQPHGPFIGDTARTEIEIYSGIADHKRDILGEEPDADTSYIWEQVREGTVEEGLAKRAYDENLEITIPHVQSIFDEVDGEIVVTSDHGNMLGERAWPLPIRLWGHPNGILTDQLVTVPWLVHQSGSRRKITAEEPAKLSVEETNDAVRQRLEKLGYR